MLYMMRSIKADFYRLIRTKGFVITYICFALFIILAVTTKTIGQIGITQINLDDMVEQQDAIKNIAWTADVALQQVMSMMEIAIYFSIPFLSIILGTDFKRKTYKNVITTGISRSEYILSKLVTLFLSISAMSLLLYFISYLGGGILSGFNGSLTLSFHAEHLAYLFYKTLFIYAALLVGVAVLYISHNTIGTVLSVILVPLLLQVSNMLIFQVDWLQYIDFLSATKIIGSVGGPSIQPYALSAIIMNVLLIAGSTYVFNKQDL